MDFRVRIRVRISSWIFELVMVSGLHIGLFRSTESREHNKKISLIIENDYLLPSVIECLINSSYFFSANLFFCLSFFVAVGCYCVTFIVVVGTLLFVIKLIR